MGKITKNNHVQFAKILLLLVNKSHANSKMIPYLSTITSNKKRATEIIKLAKTSMGQDICHAEITIIKRIAKRVIRMVDFRQKLYEYIGDKMKMIAPNLTALIGAEIGAHLLSKVGSLQQLARCPSSFIQL